MLVLNSKMNFSLFFLLQRQRSPPFLYAIDITGAKPCTNLHISKDYYLLQPKGILSFLHKKSLCQVQWFLILGHFTIITTLGLFFLIALEG
jgi:hypothetical protein